MISHTPPAPRVRRRDPAKERFWREALKAFAASGMSVRRFCRQRQLPETAFYFWRAEIGRRDGAAPDRQQGVTSRPVAFAKVLVQPASEEGLRLLLSGGRELLLPASWTAGQLADLIRALEGAA